jgi:hypothetical protein
MVTPFVAPGPHHELIVIDLSLKVVTGITVTHPPTVSQLVAAKILAPRIRPAEERPGAD